MLGTGLAICLIWTALIVLIVYSHHRGWWGTEARWHLHSSPYRRDGGLLPAFSSGECSHRQLARPRVSVRGEVHVAVMAAGPHPGAVLWRGWRPHDLADDHDVGDRAIGTFSRSRKVPTSCGRIRSW